jgi:hypothetical protein
MINVLAAFGLAAATGLNAYLPLLIVALLSRFTHFITLAPPWNTLENAWVIGLLAVLLIVETVVDKIPVVDTINDVIQTVIRPAAGAILFAASGNVISHISPVLAMICGLLMAFGVHAGKAAVRPVVTASTGGIGNSVISATEDVVSGTTTLIALILPAVAAVIVLVMIAFFIRFILRRIGRMRRASPS